MSKALRSYPEHQRTLIAQRRASSDTAGCGHWGAVDYLVKKGLGKPNIAERVFAAGIEDITEVRLNESEPPKALRVKRHPPNEDDRNGGAGREKRKSYRTAHSPMAHGTPAGMVLSTMRGRIPSMASSSRAPGGR